MGLTLQSFGCATGATSCNPIKSRYGLDGSRYDLPLALGPYLANSPGAVAAYVFYSNGALAANEFVGHTPDPKEQLYNCPIGGGISTPTCNQYTGLYIVETLGYSSN